MAVGDVAVSITKPDARQCAKFDGVDDKITITHKEILSQDNSFSISVWICAKAGQKTWPCLFSKGNNYIMKLRQNLRVTLQWHDGSGWHVDDTTDAITENEWTHIVLAWNDDTSKLYCYINGTLNKMFNETNHPATGTTDLVIGDNATSAPLETPFLGNLQKAYLFNKLLSAEEVAKLYGGTHITDGLVGYWPLKSDYLDYSGNGNNGTNSGSVLVTSDGPVAKAVANARVNASDTIFAVDVENGTRVLTGQITQA